MNFKTLTATLALATTFVAGSAFADTAYKIDSDHTEVRFGWSHAGVTVQTGEFHKTEGTLTLADDIADSTIEVTIDTNSLSSGVEALDTHLKSEDFLEVETYPTITFKSKLIEMTGDNTMDVLGDLTIHGVTNEVTLATEMTLNGEHPLGANFDSYKGQWLAFQGTTEIDHQSFEVGPFSTGPITITIATELKAAE